MTSSTHDARQLSTQFAFWWRQANSELVASVLNRLTPYRINPARLLSWCTEHGFDFLAMVGLMPELYRFLHQLERSALSRQQVVVLIEKFKALNLPEPSVSAAWVWPGLQRRPADYKLDTVPNARLLKALREAETNAYPVSDMQHAPAFATPLFATAARVLEALGTPELTLSEMARLIASNVDWHDRTTMVIRDPGQFKLTPDTRKSLYNAHELHWITGLRDVMGRDELAPGWGGEAGLFARITDPNNEFGDLKEWGSERGIFEFWEKSLQRDRILREQRRPSSATPPEQRLVQDPPLQIQSRLKAWARAGVFADQREEVVLKPFVETVLSTDAPREVRSSAAANLLGYLRSRKKLLEVVSASSVVAEIHFAQTLYRYLKINQIDLTNPQHSVNWFEVHRLYLKLLAQGQLTTLHTVVSWLEKHQVAYQH